MMCITTTTAAAYYTDSNTGYEFAVQVIGGVLTRRDGRAIEVNIQYGVDRYALATDPVLAVHSNVASLNRAIVDMLLDLEHRFDTAQAEEALRTCYEGLGVMA